MPEARAYLGDGRLELDNNICERSIRPVAPGRKNCLFPGSVGGGEAAAIACALIETAEMNNVDPEAWLTWVLERVADHGLTPSTNSCRGTGSPKTSKTRPDRTDTFYQVAFHKKLYDSIETLRGDLDEWLYSYNHERTHQGKMCCGRTPIETMIYGKQIWREKFVSRT